MRSKIIEHLKKMGVDKPSDELLVAIENDIKGPVEAFIDRKLINRVTRKYVGRMFSKTLKVLPGQKAA